MELGPKTSQNYQGFRVSTSLNPPKTTQGAGGVHFLDPPKTTHPKGRGKRLSKAAPVALTATSSPLDPPTLALLKLPTQRTGGGEQEGENKRGRRLSKAAPVAKGGGEGSQRQQLSLHCNI
ncbi:hypothetical protein GQ53DRAFT_94698 [Thozetella sp. PMI_491]|nr:hypothetical protein GQ53DRAFT_94698 [Thozetella sp. PMI_491]